VNGRTVQPFGNLRWEDALPEALERLHGMENLERFQILDINGDPIPSSKPNTFSMKENDIRKTVAEIKRMQCAKGDKRNNTPYVLDGAIRGKRVLMDCFIVNVWPVVVAQCPYRLRLIFASTAGLAVVDAERALTQSQYIFGADNQLYYPMFLDRVILTPTNEGFGKENYGHVKKILEHKYQKLAVEGTRWTDEAGNSVELLESGSIQYRLSERKQAKWQETFQKHKADEAQRTKQKDIEKTKDEARKKKDQTGDL